MADAGVSARIAPGQRPALGPALAAVTPGDALVAASADRAARDTMTILALADRADDEGWRFMIVGMIDTATPDGRLMLTMMAAMATYERDLIAARTREALTALRRGALKARGVRLGRPVEQSAAARERIAGERAAGRSYSAIDRGLNADGVPTARGGRWHPSTVSRLVRSARLDAEARSARAAA